MIIDFVSLVYILYTGMRSLLQLFIHDLEYNLKFHIVTIIDTMYSGCCYLRIGHYDACIVIICDEAYGQAGHWHRLGLGMQRHVMQCLTRTE